MKTAVKTQPSNITPFVLEGCWPLDGLDQQTMQRLGKEARRKRVGVADVIYEDVESFVAKCVVAADLEEKVIKFPAVAKRWKRDGSLIRVRQTPSTVDPRKQQDAFHRPDAQLQARSFARCNPRLRPS